MESIWICLDDRNALDKFRDGLSELLSYSVALMCDLVSNRIQDFFASFGKAQRSGTIRLDRSTVGTSVANGMFIRLTLTFPTAAQIFRRILQASCNPGTGANCRRSTPVERASWPILAAVSTKLLMVSIARYRDHARQ